MKTWGGRLHDERAATSTAKSSGWRNPPDWFAGTRWSCHGLCREGKYMVQLGAKGYRRLSPGPSSCVFWVESAPDGLFRQSSSEELFIRGVGSGFGWRIVYGSRTVFNDANSDLLLVQRHYSRVTLFMLLI